MDDLRDLKGRVIILRRIERLANGKFGAHTVFVRTTQAAGETARHAATAARDGVAFLGVVQAAHLSFVGGQQLDALTAPSVRGARRAAGVDLQKPRM